MKRIVKFVIFKVVELGVPFMVWWGLSWYGYWICNLLNGSADYTNLWVKWLIGPVLLGAFTGIFMPIVCMILIVYIGIGIYHWIKWNWEKAGG